MGVLQEILQLLAQGSVCPQQVLKERPAPPNTIFLFYQLLHYPSSKLHFLISASSPSSFCSCLALVMNFFPT